MASPVLDIIKQRHHSNSHPGRRADPYKIGLAIEGGGLRGIVSAGGLAALEALNYKGAFDVIYGASCGAYSGAFFASGNTTTGARFFLDHSQVQFVSLKRMLGGGPVFDLDYVRRSMHSLTPLNYDHAISSRPPLHVVATDAAHNRPVTLKRFENARQLDYALKASSSIPSYRQPQPLRFRGRYYLDASIFDPFCINSAIAEKCTHIMVLFSMPWQHRHNFKLLDKNLIAPYFAKINPNLAESYLKHGEYSVNGLNHIWNHFDGTHILAVAPKKSRRLPGQLTTKRKRLAHGFLSGAKTTLDHFAPDNITRQLVLANLRSELRL